MALYLIIHEDGSFDINEATSMVPATIFRLAGPGKQVTARVEQKRLVEVSDPDE